MNRSVKELPKGIAEFKVIAGAGLAVSVACLTGLLTVDTLGTVQRLAVYCFSVSTPMLAGVLLMTLHAEKWGVPDRTTLLISHRVSTARHADRIFIIDNGRIAESGTHDELMALGGYYADLAAVQSDQDEDRAKKARLLRELDVDGDALDAVAGKA